MGTELHIFGLGRVFEMCADAVGSDFQIVHTLEEAYEIVEDTPDNFTECLFGWGAGMIYGPDDKPIVPEVSKTLRTPTEKYYRTSVLKILESKMRFTDWWGPTLYDAMGNRIEWPGRPMVPVKTGRTIQFYRHVNGEAAEKALTGKSAAGAQ